MSKRTTRAENDEQAEFYRRVFAEYATKEMALGGPDPQFTLACAMARDYTVAEAAKLLGVSRRCVDVRCRKHSLGALRGSTRLLTTAEFKVLVNLGLKPRKRRK